MQMRFIQLRWMLLPLLLVVSVMVSGQRIQAQEIEDTSTIYLPVAYRFQAAIRPNVPQITALLLEDSDDQIEISWEIDTDDVGVDEFIVEFSPDEDFEFVDTTRVDGDRRSVDIDFDDEEERGTFYFRIKAVNEFGESEFSDVQTFNNSGLTVDDDSVNPASSNIDNRCTTLRWNFTGIQAFRISLGENYDQQPANGVGDARVCPSQDTTYVATVIETDGDEKNFTITVEVEDDDCNNDPRIFPFVPTEFEVGAGERFTVAGRVECVRSAIVQKYTVVDGIRPGTLIREVDVIGGSIQLLDEQIDQDTFYILIAQRVDRESLPDSESTERTSFIVRRR